ncbi:MULTISPECIES: type II toxin-antitoxin system VapC family toxin [unclassified Halorhabdus]|uniref:type II toxin-antitoxin system VapC family toxin n=1 Tax=unclassified Halorhabdus TaxID=2621901 RepID=UPI0023DB6BDA|nr:MULTISPECIES: type II toxin-antitoxin system VapC family toxin [unclassified Halorhabdus]WEL16483.1 PIN domain containing protein [Halorhabdus sp. SVX81]WEL20365.1 PIN domain containing protein [Halorhabdus sp. BNX81]
MIQDTSFVVDIIRGDEGAFEAVRRMERERIPEKLSAVTVLELYEGVAQSGRPEDERTAVLEVLDSKVVVPADQDVMRRAGQISGQLAANGERIDREDCVIAATALLEDEPVLTRNREHFERIEKVDVQTY